MSSLPERPVAFPPRPLVPRTVPAPRPRSADSIDGFDVEKVSAAFRGFLQALDLDLTDPNLAGTPERVARAYREILDGLRKTEPALRTFPNTGKYAGIVSVTDIAFHSICAHHFLPFFGSVHVAYAPGNRLVGLSKIARAVDHFARRPQLQEDLTEQVASFLQQKLTPAGLLVTIEARHLCMEMRGVARAGVTTRTTAVRGTFQDGRLQEQFFATLGSGPSSNRRE
jgi:GTP cyclohydrolase I